MSILITRLSLKMLRLRSPKALHHENKWSHNPSNDDEQANDVGGVKV